MENKNENEEIKKGLEFLNTFNGMSKDEFKSGFDDKTFLTTMLTSLLGSDFKYQDIEKRLSKLEGKIEIIEKFLK